MTFNISYFYIVSFFKMISNSFDRVFCICHCLIFHITIDFIVHELFDFMWQIVVNLLLFIWFQKFSVNCKICCDNEENILALPFYHIEIFFGEFLSWKIVDGIAFWLKTSYLLYQLKVQEIIKSRFLLLWSMEFHVKFSQNLYWILDESVNSNLITQTFNESFEILTQNLSQIKCFFKSLIHKLHSYFCLK